jgi:hypothetical protein
VPGHRHRSLIRGRLVRFRRAVDRGRFGRPSADRRPGCAIVP